VENKAAFHLALKFLKEWAGRRGVYSNVSGYLGGINWAILTAYVCQLYPTGCAALILSR
jgi:poly(A) polymerase